MKLKTLIAPAILFTLFSLSACKKSNTNSTPNNPNKLKLYIEDGTNSPLNIIDTFTVSYDAENRITALTSPNLGSVYTYNSNKSFTLDLYNNSVLSIHEILFLNSQSLVDSTFQYDDTNDTTTEKYIYNGKLLTRLTDYIYSASGSQIDTQDDYAYDNNGNRITDTQSDGFGGVNTISTFTYTNKILNFALQPIYYPTTSMNLPASQTQTDGSGNILAAVTYAFNFDSSGRVVKEKDTDTINGYTYVKTYVYY
jgi:hypothetical protein